MSEINFQINYKLNGRDMPVIEFTLPTTESASSFIYELLTIEKIYQANIETYGESNPADALVTDKDWRSKDTDHGASVHHKLIKMGVTDVSYTYKGKKFHM